MPTFTGLDPVVDFESVGSTEPVLLDSRPAAVSELRYPRWALVVLALASTVLVLLIFAFIMVVVGGSSDSDQANAGTQLITQGQTDSAIGAAPNNTANGGDVASDGVASTATGSSVGGESDATPAVSYAAEPLRLRGIGAIEFGMSVEEAERLIGGTIVPVGDATAADGCVYARLENDTAGPRFMVVFETGEFATGRIVRADLVPGTQTRSGIAIGSSEADVFAAYGDRIQVTPHKYTFAEGGEYLTFVPADTDDANFRMVIETLNDRVTAVRSGVLPAVEYAEGCA